jgi:hypothetical protein
MSSSPAVRTLRHPASDFDKVKIPRTRQPVRNWFRVHQTVHPARYFSLNPAHRFSHKDCPYPVLYLGVNIDTCLFERFGDEAYDGAKTLPQSLWNAHSVSLLQVPEICVCDLTKPGTLSALRVDLTALMNDKLDVPQEWGLAIQEHPSNFQGIKYKRQFNDRACLAVFQRDGIEKSIPDSVLGALSSLNEAANWLDKHRVRLY